MGVTTASATVSAGLFVVVELAAMGIARTNFPVVSYDLPPSVDADGLQGLNFLEGTVLTIDFINDLVSLS